MNPETATRCPVVFQDDTLLVVDKPHGILSHPNPAGGEKGRCAFEGRYDFEDRRFDSPAGPVWLLHRLDRDTSGLLLAAWDGETAEKCRALFEENKIRKTYLALVAGRPHPASGAWRDHLATRRGKSGAQTSVLRGRPSNAELRYSVRQNFPVRRCSLLEILLITGRTHQIRAQAAARGLPVAGDRVYGNFQKNREWRAADGLRRIFLHAFRLEFAHPRGGQILKLEAPLPADLRSCLENLR